MTESLTNLSPQNSIIQNPVDIIPIPSRGLVYQKPLDKSEIEIGEFTTRCQDILSSNVYLTKNIHFDMLLKHIIIDKEYGKEIDKLILGDKLALLIGVRISGIGDTIKTKVKCKYCGQEEQVVNLKNILIRDLQIKPVVPNANLFDFELPISKKKIEFKFYTVKDQKDYFNEINMKIDKNEPEFPLATKLYYHIVSIDGVKKDDKETINFRETIKDWNRKDSVALLRYIQSNEPNILTKYTYTCSKCEKQFESDFDLDFGTLFFESE